MRAALSIIGTPPGLPVGLPALFSLPGRVPAVSPAISWVVGGLRLVHSNSEGKEHIYDPRNMITIKNTWLQPQILDTQATVLFFFYSRANSKLHQDRKH